MSPRSIWRSAAAGWLLLAGAALPARASAQSGLEAACAAAPVADRGECRLALATMRAVQERVGIALWGGNAVPGTASTAGMRIGSTPRVSVAASLSLVPATIPPLLDRDDARGERTVIPSVSAHGTVGLLQGFSPLPTIGGVGSLDAVVRLSLAALPGESFDGNVVLGWQAGARLGLLRESFTMPGISVTTTYGRSGRVMYGGRTTDGGAGHVEGAVSDLNATLAVSRRIAPVRVTGGLAVDRYESRAEVGYRGGDGAPAVERATLTTDRRSVFAGAEWTALIFHTSAELGHQWATSPVGLPADVDYRPSRWWGRLAFRVSI